MSSVHFSTGHKDVSPDFEVEHTLIYSVLDSKNVVEQADIVEWWVSLSVTLHETVLTQIFLHRHKLVPELLTTGKLRVHNIDHRKGGLEAIPAGFEDMKAGNVSGKKIVYTLV